MTHDPALRNRPMRILFLAHYYPPEMGAAAARLHGLARWLVRFGHEVTVITGIPNYPSGVVPAKYRGRIGVREGLDGVEVLRTWVFASSHRSSARRLGNYLSYMTSATLAGLAAGRRFDVLIASSPPLFVGLAGWALAKRYGIPWVLDVRDIWPDIAIEMEELAPDARLTRTAQRLAGFLYRQASHITPVTENKRIKLMSHGVPASKLTVVSNGVDLDLLRSPSNGHWRETLGLRNNFVVVYTGLIGRAQGLDRVIDSALLLDKKLGIHFLIVGDGVHRQKIIHRAQQLALKNISFLPALPRDQIPSLLNAADVALVPLINSKLEDAVPSKLLEAWACQKPVLLLAGGEASQLVQRAAGGLVAPPEQPQLIAQAITALAMNPQKLPIYAQNGYRYVTTHFERQALARRMEEVLFKLRREHAG